MISRVVSTWSLDSGPKRWEVVLAVVFVIQAVSGVAVGNGVSWPWCIAGGIAFAVAIGPGAASGFGQRVGGWFRSIGVGGRGVAIVVFAVAVWTISGTWNVPRVPAYSFSTGGILAIVLIVFLRSVVSYGGHTSADDQ